MELKKYQEQVLQDIDRYLECLRETQNSQNAFNVFWGRHPRTPLAPFPGQAVEPYSNNVPGSPHVCVKVPTAGGKTLIACSALRHIFDGIRLDDQRPKVVVWLVPSISILEQTKRNLSNPQHPYRQRIDTDFNNRVVVLDKEQLLQGQDFNLSSVQENLTICVMSFDSLRARKKEERKLHQDNSVLYTFKSMFTEEEDISVNKVIQRLHPVVVVDESHNAESELSVDMLNQLEPSFVLDLTATPRKSSNIISFVDALELKKDNMVKLPVIVKNHDNKSEVIASALELRRRLEDDAKYEREQGGRYIRPIVLFQAQPRTDEDNLTFDKIKSQLVEIGIPEEQIKIKTADINEIKNIDLLAEDCPVRYIITVNALKEGWDCPFAYVLASLADKSSSVDVEQIVGRVLRLPYIRKNRTSAMLNMSYVLTASAKFADTLDNIIRGLNKAGFSDRDYRQITVPTEQQLEEKKDEPKESYVELFQQEENFSGDVSDPMSKEYGNDNESKAAAEDEINTEVVQQMVQSSQNSDTSSTAMEDIEQTAKEEEEKLNSILRKAEEEDIVPVEVSSQMKSYKIKHVFAEEVKKIQLSQFVVESRATLFGDEEVKFSKEMLLGKFKLSNCDSNIDFTTVNSKMYRVDIDATTNEHTPRYFLVDGKNYEYISKYILSMENKEAKIQQCSGRLLRLIGKMTPISDAELLAYIQKVLQNFSQDDFSNLLQYENSYAEKIKAKITALSNEYAKRTFKEWLDTDRILMGMPYELPNALTLAKTGAAISKSLYEKEDEINNFEREVITEVANLENVLFWHRNLERGKGFCINGFINHYPDFIIVTKKGKIVLLETKGDQLDAADKIELGNLWASKAGNQFRYFLVYNNREVEGALRKDTFLSRLKEL